MLMIESQIVELKCTDCGQPLQLVCETEDPFIDEERKVASVRSPRWMLGHLINNEGKRIHSCGITIRGNSAGEVLDLFMYMESELLGEFVAARKREKENAEEKAQSS